jgi:hypothetical protein
VAGQADEFGAGIDHPVAPGRFNPMSQSLQAIGQSWTAQVANEASRPHSLLQPLYQNSTGIGMDARTAGLRFPDGQLPDNPGGNGQTEESIMPTALLRMTSGDSEAD